MVHTPLIGIAVLLLGLAPSHAFAADFNNVTYHRCYDGDTCTFTLPDVHPLFGEKISVRIAGIDTPEIRGKCQKEKALAIQARNLVRRMLGQAGRPVASEARLRCPLHDSGHRCVCPCALSLLCENMMPGKLIGDGTIGQPLCSERVNRVQL